MVFLWQNNQDDQDDQGNGDQGCNGDQGNQNDHSNGNCEDNDNGDNNGNDNEGDEDNDNEGNNDNLNNRKKVVCHTGICENIKTAVPIEVRTHTDIGNITLRCNGTHIKEIKKLKHTYKFEVVQEVFARIPIDFITEVIIKDEKVDFDVHECKKY